MGKTSPDTYPVIPTGQLLPMEPVLQGGGVIKGLSDLIHGVNHITRSLTPTVVLQQMCRADYTISGYQYLWSTDAAYTDYLIYRIPTIPDIGSDTQGPATEGLQVRFWAETEDVGTDGYIRVTNLTDTAPVHITYNGGDWKEYSANLAYDSSGSYETIKVQMYRAGGSGKVALKSLTVWIERGANPCAAGVDVEPWSSDEPLAVHMYRKAVAQLNDAVKNRRGVVTNWSNDLNFARPFYSVTADTDQMIYELPVKYGPLTSELRIHLYGQSSGGTGEVRIWTGHTTEESTTVLTLPGALGWVTDTVAVKETKAGGADRLHLIIHAPAGTDSDVWSLAIWEEPVI